MNALAWSNVRRTSATVYGFAPLEARMTSTLSLPFAAAFAEGSATTATRATTARSGARATGRSMRLFRARGNRYARGIRASSAAASASRTGASSTRASTSSKKPRTISRSASPRERPRAIR
jgi:hypothetical protein